MLHETRILCTLVCEDVIGIVFPANDSLHASDPWQFAFPLHANECMHVSGVKGAKQLTNRAVGGRVEAAIVQARLLHSVCKSL